MQNRNLYEVGQNTASFVRFLAAGKAGRQFYSLRSKCSVERDGEWDRKYIGVKEERLREGGEERVLLKRSTDPGERPDQQFK